MRRSLLKVLNPCPEDFDGMSGDARRRYCERCAKHVHNLSAMTEPAARALIDAHAGQELCVRYRVRRDGSVRFAQTAARAGLLASAALALAACTGYANGEDLESPADAVLCVDQSGYTVACDELGEAIIPDDERPTSHSTVDPIVPPEETEFLGGVAVPVLEAPTPPIDTGEVIQGELPPDDTGEGEGEGCPIRTGTSSHSDEIVVGMMESSPRERRRSRRADRRWRRKQRRQG